MQTSLCRSCNATIVWCETATGKRMPVDAEPHEGGTLVLISEGAGTRVLALHFDSGDQRAERARALRQRRHRSHFATCPNAGQHRRSK